MEQPTIPPQPSDKEVTEMPEIPKKNTPKKRIVLGGVLLIILVLLFGIIYIFNRVLTYQTNGLVELKPVATPEITPESFEVHNPFGEDYPVMHEQIRAWLPQVDNFGDYNFYSLGYSTYQNYFLLSVEASSPISNREIIQGIWILNFPEQKATRLMYDDQNHMYRSAFIDWVGDFEVGFEDQLSDYVRFQDEDFREEYKEEHGANAVPEKSYLVYNLKTDELRTATYEEILPEVVDINTYTNEELGVSFEYPYREYPAYSVFNVPKDYCLENAQLSLSTDSREGELRLTNEWFELVVDENTKAFDLLPIYADPKSRCLTDDEFTNVVIPSVTIL